MKKVLVIGSNSFSGSDFIDLLLTHPDYEVLGISRSSEKETPFLPYKTKERKIQFEQIDLNRDLDRFAKLLASFKPDYVVNFAAQSEVAPSRETPIIGFKRTLWPLRNLPIS